MGALALCVPPAADGRVDDATLCAAHVAGIDEVYRVGGVQAIGAMAFGTASIPAVDVIAGPGNAYVAEAKRQVSGVVGVASAFAGPSEIVVIAGPSATPAFAAIDVVVQAEHGPDGLAWLVTWDADLLEAVVTEIGRIVDASPRRADLESTLTTSGIACLVDGPDEALAVANTVAPEHLQLMVPEEAGLDLLDGVQNAGAVFIGDWAPASLGDYIAGPNHVLPDEPDGTLRLRVAGGRFPQTHPRRHGDARRDAGAGPAGPGAGRDRRAPGPRRFGAATPGRARSARPRP